MATDSEQSHRGAATGSMAHGTHWPPETRGSSAPPPASITAAGLPARMASRTLGAVYSVATRTGARANSSAAALATAVPSKNRGFCVPHR